MDISALQPVALPPLRQDLSVFPIGKDALGTVVVALYDPVAHRYFELGTDALQLLRLWSKGTPSAIKKAMEKSGIEPPNDEEIKIFMNSNRGQ